MTKKVFTVIKAVKVDGVELSPGDDVSLEPGQAEALLGTFVEEKSTPKTVIPAAPAVATAPLKGGKATDGL